MPSLPSRPPRARECGFSIHALSVKQRCRDGSSPGINHCEGVPEDGSGGGGGIIVFLHLP